MQDVRSPPARAPHRLVRIHTPLFPDFETPCFRFLSSLQRNQGKTEIFVLQKNKKTKKNVLKTTRRFLFSSRNSLMVSLPRVPDVGCDTSPHVRALCAPELMPLAVHRGRPPPKARPKRAYSAKGSGIGIGDLGSHVRLRKALGCCSAMARTVERREVSGQLLTWYFVCAGLTGSLDRI